MKQAAGSDVAPGSQIQGDQINIDVFFWHLAKVTGSVYATVYLFTTGKSLFSRYKKHTDMYNLSPCRSIAGVAIPLVRTGLKSGHF